MEQIDINTLNVNVDVLVAKRDYLDLYKKGEIMVVILYIASGKRISGCGLKEFEINIHFDKL